MTDRLIDAIQKALDTNADDLARTRGADACRSLLAALDAKAGQPLVAAPPPPAAFSPLAAAAQALGSAPPSSVLDAIIAKLQAKLPDEPAKPVARVSLRIPYIPIPSRAGGKS